MRLADKIATMARRGAPLPYDYAVEYVKTNGVSNYYDYGVVLSLSDVFGYTVNQITNTQSLGCYNGGRRFHSDGSYKIWIDKIYYFESGNFKRIWNFDFPQKLIECNEESQSFTGSNLPAGNFFIGAINTNGSAASFGVVEIYGVSHSRNGTLAKNVIPCVKNGRPCLYDSVSHAFEYASGGTDFDAGPRVASSGAFSTEGVLNA